MRIGIVDAELMFLTKHRFPNLSSMKISNYYKQNGDEVHLLTDINALNHIDDYDKVFISCVFTSTPIVNMTSILSKPNVEYGGTGFYYDKASPLSPEIEHIMPDYHLYDDWVNQQLINKNGKKVDYKFFYNYSIGFITRGCFRHCPFCVNQNASNVRSASPLEEFLDTSRKKICLLDDNFLGFKDWKRCLEALRETGKPFQFCQGLDERILTPEKCKLLFSSKYDGYIRFAFDNVEDKDLIVEKLHLIKEYTDKELLFYVLCGYDRNNKYDLNFWRQDILNAFIRISILREYGHLLYIMRYNKYTESPYRQMYVALARWCNQHGIFRNFTFSGFCERDNEYTKKEGACMRSLNLCLKEIPEIRSFVDI